MNFEHQETYSRLMKRLQGIANLMLLSIDYTNDLGLKKGRLGKSIFFYNYSKLSHKRIYNLYADDIIDYAFNNINKNDKLNFSQGLTGIGFGIEYLIRNRFVEADADDVLEDFDKRIYNVIRDKELFNKLYIDICYYSLSRLSSMSRDNFKNLIHLDSIQTCLAKIVEAEKNSTKQNTNNISSIIYICFTCFKCGVNDELVNSILPKIIADIEQMEISNDFFSIIDLYVLLNSFNDVTLEQDLNFRINSICLKFTPFIEKIDLFQIENGFYTFASIISHHLIVHGIEEFPVAINKLTQQLFKWMTEDKLWHQHLHYLHKDLLSIDMGIGAIGIISNFFLLKANEFDLIEK